MFKLLTSRNVISVMGKRFSGIWSKDLRQTMEKAITEKMEHIVQLPFKENKQQKMDEFKSEMDELIRAFLKSHQQIEKEFNEKMKKMIEDQQQRTTIPSVQMPDNTKMGNLDQQAIKVSNPAWKRWDKILIQLEKEDFDGEHLNVSTDDVEWHNVFALNGFPISRKQCGNGTELSTARKTIYYYEVSVQRTGYCELMVGLSGGLPSDYTFDECHPNFYYLHLENGNHHCCQSGTKHKFELPTGAIKPEWKSSDQGSNEVGCGILLHSNGKMFIFFALNGNLLGKPIPITPSVDRLYPTVRMSWTRWETPYDYDPAISFSFDIGTCAELNLLE